MPQGDYRVLLESRAEKDLDKLESTVRERVIRRLFLLRQNPRPPGAKKLEGVGFAWRIRIGDWRVIYEINDRRREVQVYRVRHRSDAY